MKARYPHLEIILEPGSAFTWQTGPLVASVVDIVENRGIKTAILDVSFTCHMPDCLEMPYQPAVRDAKTLPVDAIKTALTEENVYRLGGNSCLSGDYMGSWCFDHPLQIGERIVLEDMIHYTMVKQTCLMESITLLLLFGIQIIHWKYIKTSDMRIIVTVCLDSK